jgi:hypothetical protein
MVEMMFGVGGAVNTTQLIEQTPWLKRCTEITKDQRFFHWELDFAAAFDRGGFDLQVGNPPWVRPRPDVAALLGGVRSVVGAANKPSNAEKKERRERRSTREGRRRAVLLGFTGRRGARGFVGSGSMYPEMVGRNRISTGTSWPGRGRTRRMLAS